MICPHVMTQYDILVDELRKTNETHILALAMDYGEQVRQLCDHGYAEESPDALAKASKSEVHAPSSSSLQKGGPKSRH